MLTAIFLHLMQPRRTLAMDQVLVASRRKSCESEWITLVFRLYSLHHKNIHYHKHRHFKKSLLLVGFSVSKKTLEKGQSYPTYWWNPVTGRSEQAGRTMMTIILTSITYGKAEALSMNSWIDRSVLQMVKDKFIKTHTPGFVVFPYRQLNGLKSAVYCLHLFNDDFQVSVKLNTFLNSALLFTLITFDDFNQQGRIGKCRISFAHLLFRYDPNSENGGHVQYISLFWQESVFSCVDALHSSHHRNKYVAKALSHIFLIDVQTSIADRHHMVMNFVASLLFIWLTGGRVPSWRDAGRHKIFQVKSLPGLYGRRAFVYSAMAKKPIWRDSEVWKFGKWIGKCPWIVSVDVSSFALSCSKTTSAYQYTLGRRYLCHFQY